MNTGCVGLLILLAVGQAPERPMPSTPPEPTSPFSEIRSAIALDGQPATPERLPTPKASSSTPATPPASPPTMPAAEMQSAVKESFARDHAGPQERVWFGGGPLLWWIKDIAAPGPLVTTGSPRGIGALGQPDTVVLLGDQDFDFDEFLGFQVRGGTWLGCNHTYGIEFGGFMLEQLAQGATFRTDAAGNPLLARPVTNAVTGTPTGVTVGAPGTFLGVIDVSTNTQFYGGDVNLLRNLSNSDTMQIDLLCGFRYLDLDENLHIAHSSQVLGSPGALLAGGTTLPPSSVLTVADRFSTRNQFYGGQIGGRAQFWRGSFFLNVLTKVAFGPNHEVVKITGSTTATLPDGSRGTLPGGLLALPGTNLGRSTTDWFVIVPEVGAELGVQMTDNIRISAGYNYLYINNVIRPGSQVNANVNPALVPSSAIFGLIPTPREPRVLTRQEDFFIHGLTLNMELRF